MCLFSGNTLGDTKAKKMLKLTRKAGGDKCYDEIFKRVKRQRMGTRGVTPDYLVFEDMVFKLRLEKQEGAAMQRSSGGHS